MQEKYTNKIFPTWNPSKKDTQQIESSLAQNIANVFVSFLSYEKATFL